MKQAYCQGGQIANDNITHCLGILHRSWMSSTPGPWRLKTNLKDDSFKDRPFLNSGPELPAPRKQTDQLHQSVDGRCPLKTYSPLGPQSVHRSRLSLWRFSSFTECNQRTFKSVHQISWAHKIFSASSPREDLRHVPDVGWTWSCSKVHLCSSYSHLGPDVW